MRGWTNEIANGTRILLGLSLALAGTAAFLLLALLGGYVIAMGVVALIVLAPVALAELEFREGAAGPGTEARQAPEPLAHRPITISEGPTQPRPAGDSAIRRVA